MMPTKQWEDHTHHENLNTGAEKDSTWDENEGRVEGIYYTLNMAF